MSTAMTEDPLFDPDFLVKGLDIHIADLVAILCDQGLMRLDSDNNFVLTDRGVESSFIYAT